MLAGLDAAVAAVFGGVAVEEEAVFAARCGDGEVGVGGGRVEVAEEEESVALKGEEGHPSGNIVYMTLICAAAMAVALVGTFFLPKSLANMGKKKTPKK